MADRVQFSYGTYAEYMALSSHDDNTIYFVTNPNKIFKGDVEYTSVSESVNVYIATISAISTNGTITHTESATKNNASITSRGQIYSDGVITPVNVLPLDEESHRGDIIVVKTEIGYSATSKKYQYTGYVYNGSVFEAMDGNYDATNVFINEDIKYFNIPVVDIKLDIVSSPIKNTNEFINIFAIKINSKVFKV